MMIMEEDTAEQRKEKVQYVSLPGDNWEVEEDDSLSSKGQDREIASSYSLLIKQFYAIDRIWNYYSFIGNMDELFL